MSLSEAPEGPTGRSFGVTWSAAIAGAVVAAALAFVLDSFGVAIGLGLSSASANMARYLICFSAFVRSLSFADSPSCVCSWRLLRRQGCAARMDQPRDPDYDDGMLGC